MPLVVSALMVALRLTSYLLMTMMITRLRYLSHNSQYKFPHLMEALFPSSQTMAEVRGTLKFPNLSGLLGTEHTRATNEAEFCLLVCILDRRMETREVFLEPHFY